MYHRAVYENDLETVKTLFDTNEIKDVNEVDGLGITALHLAVISPSDQEKKAKLIELLLDKGASLTLRAPKNPYASVSPTENEKDKSEKIEGKCTKGIIRIHLSNNNEITTNGKSSRGYLDSICFPYYMKKGKWYYEVLLLTSGLFQIGWSSSLSSFTPEVLL